MRFLMVTKLVSMPPSQRLLTYGWSARVASWATGSWACFLVPDEQDLVAAGDGLADEVERDVQALDGLGQVDDVDPVALGEDERAHLGVPAAGLVAEVDSGLEQLPHRNGRHGERPPVGSFLRGPRRRGPAGSGPAGTVPVGTVRVCAPRLCGAGVGSCLVARGQAPDRAGV